MYTTLRHDQEQIPMWLEKYQRGIKIDLREILSHRVLFYPGAGDDGQPIKALNKYHTLHTYLYSDYGANLEEVVNMFRYDKIKGYTALDIIILDIIKLLPENINADMCIDHRNNHINPNKFCAICIYEREISFDDIHGAKRFALLYTNEDAYRVFNIVFHPTNHIPPPYVIVLQDHGFGGNYGKWGKGGLLERIAFRYKNLPKYYIIGTNNTIPWSDSKSCHDGIMIGGCGRWPRELYINNGYLVNSEFWKRW